MNWIKYTFAIPTEKLDLITAVLTDIPYLQGIEIEDYSLTEEECKAMFVDILPEEMNQKREQTPISFYLSEETMEKAEEIRELLRPYLQGEIAFTTQNTVEEDWANSWKQYYHSFSVGDNIYIYPIWEEKNENYPINIGLDPGMAFGSGTHETTELCMVALEKYLKNSDKVLDVGTGSGILAIAAAKLGASEVLAIDLDENAVKVAVENIAYNEVEKKVKVRVGNLAEDVKESYDIVVANILADVICLLAKDVKKLLKSGGLFISSGIIADKLELVKETFAKEGLKVTEIAQKGEWRMVAAYA